MDERTKQFIAAAEAEIGTPFVHQGKTSRGGLDCTGLVYVAAKAVGVRIALEHGDERGYGKEINHWRFLLAMHRRFRLVEGTDPQPGQIPVFWRKREGSAQHCGIVDATGEWVIHCSDEAGVTKSRLPGFWRSRIISVFELP